MRQGVAPVLCSVLWAAQTVSTALYVSRGNTGALMVMGAVAAAEVIKSVAAGAHCGWKSAHPRPHYLICAFCSVSCSALAYPVLARTNASNYVQLLAIQHTIVPILQIFAHGGETTRRDIFSAAAGLGAYAVVAIGNQWAALAALVQSLLVCFADAIDATADDDPKRELFTASVFTSWTALMIFFGSLISNLSRAADAEGPHAFAAITIVLMAATGICRGYASAEPQRPVLSTTVELLLVTGGSIVVLGQVPSAASAVGAVLATIAAL